MAGLKWGEDLERDCAELRKLESWGIYPSGYHDQNCPLWEQHQLSRSTDGSQSHSQSSPHP